MIDRDNIVTAVGDIAEALGDVDALRKAKLADYESKRARIDLLIEDRRVEELDDGLLRYHLTKSIKDEAGQVIEYLTFKRPTVRVIREGAKHRVPEEWGAYLIRVLSKEIADDATLGRIDGAEWDDIVEVVQFPFEHAPSRRGAETDTTQASSGRES